MKTVDLFQFNASTNIPATLQRTTMDIVEVCNSVFRPFFRNVANRVQEEALNSGCTHIVEMGAGNAPITRRLLESSEGSLTFTVCDLMPDEELYARLEKEHPKRVQGLTQAVDFTIPRQWPPQTLLVLVACFHHVPVAERAAAFETLTNSADRVMLFSPVKKTLFCMFAAVGILVPGLLVPLIYIHRPARLRRMFWCWLLPIAPLIMLWDGVGGCVRQWTTAEWKAVEQNQNLPRSILVESTPNSQTVIC